MQSQHIGGSERIQKFSYLSILFSLFISHLSLGEEGVPLHGFADVGYGRATNNRQQAQLYRGFNVGTLDFYLTPQFSDNVKALAELALDVGPDSLVEGLDAERLQLGYVFSEYATLWAGRFHTPYGFWQTAYHHGAQLQPSIYKPRFLDWEDHEGILPAHSVGLWLTGKARMGEGKWIYDLFISNGSRINGGRMDMNLFRDNNTSTAFGGRLSYQFGGSLDGLIAGVHGLSQEIDVVDNEPPSFRNMVNMYGGFAAYESDHFEADAELFTFSNSDLTQPNSPSHSSWMGFAHMGYYILPDLMPYIRVERAKLDQTDSQWNQQINGYSYDRILFGLRYNINARTCIKLEGNHTNNLDSLMVSSYTTNVNGNSGSAYQVNAGSYDEVRAQYAIAF